MEHHAYIYEGALSQLPAVAQDARGRFGFAGEHNPDVHVREFERLGIEESRWLSQTAALRGTAGRALFLIGAGSLTSEAQQALLKLFEEPQRGTIFVLLAPHGVLLPTLRSRMMEYPAKIEAAAPGGEARAFLKARGKARSDFVAKLLKDEEGAKERVRELLLGLEQQLSQKIAEPKAQEALQDIAKVRSYVGDRSASLKMLLEHLAVALPVL